MRENAINTQNQKMIERRTARMKLIDKQIVEATKPTIYIGKRTYKNKRTGDVHVAKPYWAEYFANGRQHQEPLGTNNKATAIRAAYALAERIERGQQRIRDSRRTIQELADAYYAYCEGRGRARKTLVKYKGQLERFKEWCKSEGIRRARTFSPNDLFAYRAYLSEQHRLSDKSIYNETIIIKQLFKWATKNGFLSRNLLESLHFEKVKSPKQPCFTIEQVELLISNAESWAVPMFATLAFTGMRIGELQQLQWEDVDIESNIIHVHRGGSGNKPKDKEDRFIPIHGRKLKPVLQRLPSKSDFVFLMPNGRKVSPKKLRRYLKNLCKQCGFQNPLQYKLHTFRHFFASYCAQQNLSYKYVLEWMGHSSSAILDMYFTMNDRHALAAMNSMSFEAEKAKDRTVLGQSGTHFQKALPQLTHS
jgi:site-specific recombinase XerD